MKVLVAIDSMLYGKVLSDFIVNHHWAPGTKLRLIHVLDRKRSDLNFDAEWRKASEILEQVTSKIKDTCHSVDISHQIILGDPEKEIVDMASTWSCDLVVLGSHTKSEVARLLLGSVSSAVSLKVPCSVVVLRLPAELRSYSNKACSEATSVVNS